MVPEYVNGHTPTQSHTVNKFITRSWPSYLSCFAVMDDQYTSHNCLSWECW